MSWYIKKREALNKKRPLNPSDWSIHDCSSNNSNNNNNNNSNNHKDVPMLERPQAFLVENSKKPHKKQCKMRSYGRYFKSVDQNS